MNRVSLFVLTALATLPASAQIEIPLDNLSAKAANVNGVTLDQSMLKLAAGVLGGKGAGEKGTEDNAKNSGLQKILASVKSVEVKRYAFVEEGAYQMAELEPLRVVLRNAGWSQMFTHAQDGVQNTVYFKLDGLQIGGVTVIRAQPRDVTIVSVEGVIDLATLAELAGHVGIPKDLSNIDQQPDQTRKADTQPAN